MEESVQVRNSEAAEVCRRLGARMHHVGISNIQLEPQWRHLQALAEHLRRIRPELLLVPWLLDYPAKHRFVNHLLWLTHYAHGIRNCEVWGYQVHNGLIPNGFVDITEVAESKWSLLRVFRSQNGTFACYDHIAMGLAAWNARLLHATEPRYVELFTALPLKEYLLLVERFYFEDLERTYRHHREVLPGMTKFHEQVTSLVGQPAHRQSREQRT